jgi:anti-sigma factor RsiW
MQCEHAGALIGAYLDQELDADLRREMAAHLEGCPACAAASDELGRMSRQVAAIGRERAPSHLAAGVRKVLEGTAGDKTLLRGLADTNRAAQRAWMRQAAALVIACGLTMAVTASLVWLMASTSVLEREVAAAHVRSLLQDSPIQIASSDSHAIKPWFAGRLDFAPAVRDLTAEGFPLAGARLDYVGERRVAALVYRRRMHIVNVFLWPSADASDSAPRELAYRGYNVIAWRRNGIDYWAISDLSAGELRELQSRL